MKIWDSIKSLFRKPEPDEHDPYLEIMLNAAWQSGQPVLGNVKDDGTLEIEFLDKQHHHSKKEGMDI